MKFKRIVAYIIDTIIVTIISSLIFSLPVFSDYTKKYEDVYNEFLEELEYIENTGSAEYDESRLLDIEYDMVNSQKQRQIIDVGLLIIYFGIFAYLADGQTIGKKMLKIKVVGVKNQLQPHLFILRSILLTNFIPNLISVIVLITCSKETWLAVNNVVVHITYFTTFIILGFMIFRDDERGLHDLLCDTNVVDIKKVTQK